MTLTEKFNACKENIIIRKETQKARTIRMFAKQGIYCDGEHIYHHEFGMIPLLVINGNDKIGDGVWHFSTLPTNKYFVVYVNGKEYREWGTCPQTCGEYREVKRGKNKGKMVWVSTCYATKGNYNYDSTKKSLMIKTWLIRHDLNFVYRAITAQIEAFNILVLRVHASGDFDSKAYVDMWKRIAIENPNLTMWTYTKRREFEHEFDDIPNFNVVKSVIAGKGYNYGHCDYILMLYEYLKAMGKRVYICRCGVDKGQHCNKCTACAQCDYVLFLEHSTDYKAEKDPLFPAVKALIESQDKSFLVDIFSLNKAKMAAN